MRLFKASFAGAGRPGERSLLMSEQLTFQECFWQRGAIDRDEGPGALIAGGFMDGLRDHLLAGARFSHDQHRRHCLRHLADQVEDIDHAAALAEDVVERIPFANLLPQRGDFVLERPLAQRPLDQEAQMLRIDRLGQKIIGPLTHGLDGIGDAAVAGRDHDRDRELALLNLVDQVHAAHLRHAQVGDDDAVGPLLQHLQGLGAVVGRVHFDFERQPQEFLNGSASILHILDDQQPLQ